MPRTSSGTKLVVTAFGLLCGFTGIIAGIFEILQGPIATHSLEFSYIGSKYAMAQDFTYFAITIIPNLVISGILAILFSLSVIVWSVRYIFEKNGVLIFFFLSIAQMLVGGGWVIDMAIITCGMGLMVNKPHTRFHSKIPQKSQQILVRVFPYATVVYGIVALGLIIFSVLGVDNQIYINLIENLAGIMFFPLLLMILGGLAHDSQSLQSKITDITELK